MHYLLITTNKTTNLLISRALDHPILRSWDPGDLQTPDPEWYDLGPFGLGRSSSDYLPLPHANDPESHNLISNTSYSRLYPPCDLGMAADRTEEILGCPGFGLFQIL